jgi:hypothetical protein
LSDLNRFFWSKKWKPRGMKRQSSEPLQLTQIRITHDSDALAAHLARLDGLIAFDGYRR